MSARLLTDQSRADSAIVELDAEILGTFTVAPDGCGYFSPRLAYGVRYVLELEGLCRAGFWTLLSSYAAVDAVYLYGVVAVGTDFQKPCANLRFDSKRAPLPFYKDGERHLYRFAVIGTGEKVAVSFMHELPRPRGVLAATVYLPTAEDAEILGRAQATEDATALALERERTDERSKRIRELTAAVDDFAHYEDPAFLRNYAVKNTAALLKERKQIIEETVRFHADAEFVDLLKRVAPNVYERSRWRARALAFAEQVAVQPSKTPRKARAAKMPALPPPRPRLTPDEYRARELARLDVRVKDALALVEKQQRTRQATEEMLDQLGVDADDREMYRQTVARVFDENEEAPDALAAKKF